MKPSKKILLTALSATLAASLVSGTALAVFADEATKDHVYDAKNDFMFEDFDRDDISDTVAVDGSGLVKTGEKPYLRVAYTAGSSASATDPIYKHGSQSLGNVQDGGSITLVMRAPDEDVELSEIMFGLRGVDNDNTVFAMPLSELYDSDQNPMPELSTEWKTYEISFATSFEETDVYPHYDGEGSPYPSTATDVPVVGADSTPLLGIHIFAATDEDEGTLDIASVSYTTTGTSIINNFTGGDDVQTSAKAADAGAWWAGSSEGYIVKRTVDMTGGSFTVIRSSTVGSYPYAVIEAEGDVANLKIATTGDGATWSTPAAYDGYSINLNGSETGFKFVYEGEESVTIKRIYLTYNVTPDPAWAIPVIDASTAVVLEDFSVAQSGITSNYEDMAAAPELVDTGISYRISYANGEKVEVKDGSLVFDATNLDDGAYINFKFLRSNVAATGKYIVLKVKGEGGADLTGFRFGLGNPDDANYAGTEVWSHQMRAGHDLPAALMTDGNPYKDDGWYYVVVDLEESGFPLYSNGYAGMDMYYSGTGKLYIDTVFFCDGIDVNVPNIENDIELPDSKIEFAGSEAGYSYAGYLYIPNDGYGTEIELDITPATEDFDISSLRIEFGGVGTFWAVENEAGSLVTTDGKLLSELTYTKDVATHVVIDMAASGIKDAFMHTYVHVGAIGAFKIDNVKIHTSTPVFAAKDIDYDNFDTENAFVIADEKTFTAEADGYAYAFAYENITAKTYDKFEFTLVPGAGFTGAQLRFEFAGTDVTYYFDQNEDIVTADGKKFSELTFTEGTPVRFSILLADIGVNSAFTTFHVHTTGTTTGSFTMKDIELSNYSAKDFITPAIEKYYAPKYAEQLALLDTYLDTVSPEVSVTTATTATAGDEITVTYTASDNITAAADLNVTVSVTKDGAAVTLENNKFTAEEGVYTVTVTVRDGNGNEASDTIQITVEGNGTTPVAPPANEGCSGGCGATTVEGGIMAGGMAIMGIGVLFIVNKLVRRKRKN